MTLPNDDLFLLLKKHLSIEELEDVSQALEPFYEIGRVGFRFAPIQNLNIVDILNVLLRVPGIDPLPLRIVPFSLSRLLAPRRAWMYQEIWDDMRDNLWRSINDRGFDGLLQYRLEFNLQNSFYESLYRTLTAILFEDLMGRIWPSLGIDPCDGSLGNVIEGSLLFFLGCILAESIAPGNDWGQKAQTLRGLLEVIAKGYVPFGPHKDDPEKYMVICA